MKFLASSLLFLTFFMTKTLFSSDLSAPHLAPGKVCVLCDDGSFVMKTTPQRAQYLKEKSMGQFLINISLWKIRHGISDELIPPLLREEWELIVSEETKRLEEKIKKIENDTVTEKDTIVPRPLHQRVRSPFTDYIEKLRRSVSNRT